MAIAYRMLTMTNTMLVSMSLPTTAELMVDNGTFIGRSVANGLRGPKAMTEAEADKAKCPAGECLLWQAWQGMCLRHGWDVAACGGWSAAVDAYYDRMTGQG